ncbi:hypothetical protein [Amycolatopsis sp. cmx-11-51]|uniref:hypothetical protein n=1 Tax=unclassified Amycolatopsis TaxID=2618356 RepID=UPI0039E32907
MHDVVSHHISVISVQANLALRLRKRPKRSANCGVCWGCCARHSVNPTNTGPSPASPTFPALVARVREPVSR